MPEYMTKAETLQYVTNLSGDTIQKMKDIRKKFVDLAADVEQLGSSRELSTAFTAIEHAQMLVIKHLCLVDEQGQFIPAEV